MKFLPPIIFTVIVFGSIAFWFFIRPQMLSNKTSLAGEVIYMEKQRRSGKHLITVKENGGTKWMYYSFQNIFDILVGDSLFKRIDSDSLFVKRKSDGLVRLARDQDYLLGQ